MTLVDYARYTREFCSRCNVKLLSEATGAKVNVGKIVHGDDHVTSKVNTAALAGKLGKLISEITMLVSTKSPPDPILNRHCAECEFQSRCRQKAIEKDDLSLLSNMTAKERKKLHSKGIYNSGCRHD
jgi:predicted RecB family nuclease